MRGGVTYGETDEFGYKVVDKKCEMHDLHATILYQLGIDHERLTYRFGGPRSSTNRRPRPCDQRHSGLTLECGSEATAFEPPTTIEG